MLAANANGFFPTTPATNLLFGLREALRMLQEEGLPRVFARHRRLAEAARAAVRAWDLEILCEREDELSPVVTTVVMPAGHDADRFRAIVLDRFNMSLGAGLGRLKGRAFRIGHLGDFNELMLIGTLGGVELGLAAAGVPFQRGGVQAAIDVSLEPRARRRGRQRPVNFGGRFARNADDAFAEVRAARSRPRRASSISPASRSAEARRRASAVFAARMRERRIAARSSRPARRRRDPTSPGSASRVTSPLAAASVASRIRR